MITDVAVIGGGAAGLSAAIRLKQLKPQCSVMLFEQLPRVGKKLIVTGNGRCNISNRKPELSRYHGKNPSFAQYALNKYGNAAAEEFFARLGVLFCYDETGRAYPYSLQAGSVVDALRFSAEENGVIIRTENRVTGIKKQNSIFCLQTETGIFSARCILVATGLFAGGEKLGSNGSVFRMLKEMGYPAVRTSPAIVQVKTNPQQTRTLKGIKVNASAQLCADRTLVRHEYGEVLFCDYGLSGPPILQISRFAEQLKDRAEINLDLMPEYSFSALYGLLSERAAFLSGRTLGEFFTGMLNKRVGQEILKSCGCNLNDTASVLNTVLLKQITATVKKMTFPVTGTTGFVNAQVTAGGLDTDAFFCNTMMSRRDSGMFAAGEILDIDGDCGGFNLQWAWSSAFVAADGIIRYLEDFQW